MTDPDKYGFAQEYLSGLVFNRWYRFDEIPENIFTEVFNLIDENWRWNYYLDDFDESFKKELTGYIHTSRRASEREKKREEFRLQQVERWEKGIFNNS